MAIRVIDEITPNGRTFPIADVNNIRGGIHYAPTHAEMLAIHISRLVDGTQCYVQDEKKFYIYDYENREWKLSTLGSELNYKCTVDTVEQSAMSTGTIGNLPKMTREKLEKLTVNDIFTRALFAEQLPYTVYTPPSFAPLKVEVGTKPAADMFHYKPGNLDMGFVLDKDNKACKVNYTYPEDRAKRTVRVTSVIFGNNPNYVTSVAQCQPRPIPDNITSLLRSSWGRDMDDYMSENPDFKLPDFSNIIMTTGAVTGDVSGYYKAYYMPGTVAAQDTLYNDYSKNGIYIVGQSAAHIRALSDIENTAQTIQVGTDVQTGLPNTAFVYFLIPQSLKISEVYMRNGLTNRYDRVSAFRFGKVDDQLKADGINIRPTAWTERRYNGIKLYNYDVWFVAKGDKNAKGAVSCSTAPLKIVITHK